MTNEQIKTFIEQQTHLTAIQTCSCGFKSSFVLFNDNFAECFSFRRCHKSANGSIDAASPLTDLEQEIYLKDKCKKILQFMQSKKSGGKNGQQNK